jgi:hypothetical protein
MSRLAASTDKTGCRQVIPGRVDCIAFPCMSERALVLAARRILAAAVSRDHHLWK